MVVRVTDWRSSEEVSGSQWRNVNQVAKESKDKEVLNGGEERGREERESRS